MQKTQTQPTPTSLRLETAYRILGLDHIDQVIREANLALARQLALKKSAKGDA